MAWLILGPREPSQLRKTAKLVAAAKNGVR
jgi:hypothetical protein